MQACPRIAICAWQAPRTAAALARFWPADEAEADWKGGWREMDVIAQPLWVGPVIGALQCDACAHIVLLCAVAVQPLAPAVHPLCPGSTVGVAHRRSPICSKHQRAAAWAGGPGGRCCDDNASGSSTRCPAKTQCWAVALSVVGAESGAHIAQGDTNAQPIDQLPPACRRRGNPCRQACAATQCSSMTSA